MLNVMKLNEAAGYMSICVLEVPWKQMVIYQYVYMMHDDAWHKTCSWHCQDTKYTYIYIYIYIYIRSVLITYLVNHLSQIAFVVWWLCRHEYINTKHVSPKTHISYDTHYCLNSSRHMISLSLSHRSLSSCRANMHMYMYMYIYIYIHNKKHVYIWNNRFICHT